MLPAERRALLLLLGLAVAGQGVRVWATRPQEAPGGLLLLSDRPGGLAAHRDSSAQAGRPLGPGERVDVDRASAAELARLPRVGPGLARVIVADREAKGAFGALEVLDRVPGIGPALLAQLAPHVSFSAPPPPPGPPFANNPIRPAPDGPSGGAPSAIPTALNLNTATAEQLTTLPGIGPALARRIVAYRDAHGQFTSPDQVARVAGIGPRMVARLGARIGAW